MLPTHNTRTKTQALIRASFKPLKTSNPNIEGRGGPVSARRRRRDSGGGAAMRALAHGGGGHEGPGILEASA